jgi:hypothetical protein
LLRRGGEVLKHAAEVLAKTSPGDPADPHLIWLAAATRSQSVRDQLVRLAGDPQDSLRFQAVRALHEFFPKDDQSGAVFRARLADANPHVALAATIAFFDAPSVPYEALATVAGSDDTYLRQSASMALAERAPLDFLQTACSANDEPTRLAGVLAAGFRLTLPPADKPIAASLPLAPWKTGDVYRVRYLDQTIDLRKLGRLGLFTMAEHWNAQKHSAEQERLFALLSGRLDDRSERVRLQAAHFLSLLADHRSEPKVAMLHKQTERRRLVNAPLKQLGRAWVIGPFADAGGGLSTAHPPEEGPIDLFANYRSDTNTLVWRTMKNDRMFDFIRRLGRPTAHRFMPTAASRVQSDSR